MPAQKLPKKKALKKLAAPPPSDAKAAAAPKYAQIVPTFTASKALPQIVNPAQGDIVPAKTVTFTLSTNQTTGRPPLPGRPPPFPGHRMDLAAARTGFAGIDADPTLKDKALANLTAWLTKPEYASYLPQLEWLVGAGQWSLLLDSFYQVLPF